MVEAMAVHLTHNIAHLMVGTVAEIRATVILTALLLRTGANTIRIIIRRLNRKFQRILLLEQMRILKMLPHIKVSLQ